MHIKKLEIAGFKSFVDSTVIHFDHDIVGIVGPNGCGKSNIVDAIRWCMGEQSAKHLRGRAMEDVIFNGSDSRGQAGLAEVTLTFDNSDPAHAQELPEEYRSFAEIAVTRRLFRDGTSEYLLNRTQVRLRDITELFLGTGVGTKAYSIIEQGRIGQVVSARPEDRRIFIEEAAGITKYKQRRRQAERKMELTRQNLLRITDIVSEIERNRNSLKRQVAKAERYLQYRSELEDLSLHEASHKLLELIVTSRVQREGLEESGARAEELRAELSESEAGLEGARDEAAELEIRSEDASREAFEADNEVSGLQAEISRAQDRLTHLDQRLRSSQLEQQQLAERRSALLTEREDLETRLAHLSQDESAREADAAAEDAALGELRAEESAANDQLREERAAGSEAQRAAATAEARLDGLAQRMSEARSREERLRVEQEQLAVEMGALQARKNALEVSVAELAEGKRLTAEQKAQLEAEVTELRPRALESERAVETLKNELGVRRNRLLALEDLHRRHEGVGAGVRAILKARDPAVLGIVADRIEAPERYTQAFAGLLGDRLQYVVVSDVRRGLELLAQLRREERGRAHLVPARPRYVAGSVRQLPDDPGVIGFLAEVLNYDAQDEALVRSLVGDAVVLEDCEAALRVVASSSGVTAVTLDGTVVRADGVIIGGSGDDVASAMVEQRRELRELGDEVARLSAEYGELSENHQAITSRLSEVGAALEQARQGAHEGELAHVTAEKDLGRTSAELERSRERAATIEGDCDDLANAIESISEEDSTCQADLDSSRARLEHLQHSLARAEATAQEWRERVAAQSTLLTERKVRLAQVREQTEAARVSLERVLQGLDELAARADRLAEEMHEMAQGIGETAAQLIEAREQREAAGARAAGAHDRLREVRALLEEVRHALAARDSELKHLREEREQADEAVRRTEMALQRLDLEREHLLQSVRDKFRGLDLPRVVGDYHARPAPDAEQHSRINELTQLIDRMGPVNLDAKAEFDDAERRYTELKAQKEDIDQALLELERAIKHMDRESRTRFKDAFEAVNELFKKTFLKLFRGGRAELMLSQPDDLLATGVDIVAQPPGKKLGNIELMSGGEKALTAVSLIFAIFQYKPSPFCVLDEVDAPLDEANVARYNDAIRSMTDMSQFILITHIRKTMQLVDVLYGVTMGEPGVSRVVSVKVNQEATTRSDAQGRNVLESGAPAAEAEPADSVQSDDESQVA